MYFFAHTISQYLADGFQSKFMGGFSMKQRCAYCNDLG